MSKSIKIFAAFAMVLALASCGGLGNLGSLGTGSSSSSSSSSTGSILGGILGSATSGETIGNVLGSVLGTNKPSESDIVGTWKYKQPGVAFTSDNALAKAGGEAVATQIKNKLQNSYSKIGFKSSNTYLTFNSDKSFSGKLDGKEPIMYDRKADGYEKVTVAQYVAITGRATGNDMLKAMNIKVTKVTDPDGNDITATLNNVRPYNPIELVGK